MKKKVIIIDNEKQEKLLKEALALQKFNRQLGLKQRTSKEKEDKIEDIYEIEKLEKQIN